jgi:predicted transcriptional regulator
VDLSAFDSDEMGRQNNQDHFKYQYNTSFDKNGNTNTDYSSISQFMDKSIMGAAYALRKENVKIDYILAAPSSSKYNHYYCINLSRKLGVQYNPRFFTRNLINVKFDEEACRKAGISENIITSTKSLIKSAAITEISSFMMAVVKNFVKENWDIIQTIPISAGGKRGAPAMRISSNLACEILKKYSYYGLANIGAFNSSKNFFGVKQKELNVSHQSEKFGTPKTSNVFKYLVNHFNEYINTKDSKFKNIDEIVNRFVNGLVTKGLSMKLQHMLKQITNIVNTYEAQLLSEKGYSLSYSKKFKITDIDKKARPFIKDAYVVADKELAYTEDDKLDALRSSLMNKTFLIVDEDMNSGGTLKLLIEALKDKPIEYGGDTSQKIRSDQITCLVNLWTLK